MWLKRKLLLLVSWCNGMEVLTWLVLPKVLFFKEYPTMVTSSRKTGRYYYNFLSSPQDSSSNRVVDDYVEDWQWLWITIFNVWLRSRQLLQIYLSFCWNFLSQKYLAGHNYNNYPVFRCFSTQLCNSSVLQLKNENTEGWKYSKMEEVLCFLFFIYMDPGSFASEIVRNCKTVTT